MDERLAGKHVVLLGIGHTNAHVVRMWGMAPIPDADLTCISDRPIATYSGMLPAVLAGQIPPEDMQIDLVQLCASVGARLIIDDVTGIDASAQQVLFGTRPSVPFDALSIGIGSVPTMSDVTVEGQSLVKIKPMQTFRERLAAVCDSAIQRIANSSPLRVVVAGGGVAGVEIALCVSPFLSERSPRFQVQMVTRGERILPATEASTSRKAEAVLKEHDIPVTTGFQVAHVDETGIRSVEGTRIEADIVIWATGAAPPPLLQSLALPLSSDGFLATDSTLRTTSGAPIFAVGDTGTIVEESLPKAGVYAVRQGPVVWDNIQRLLKQESLRPFVPQRSFLKLLNTGDGRAIGERSGISFSGRWVMKLKEFIDSRFMKMFQDVAPMDADDVPMQCRGCGCKLGGDVLVAALQNAKLTGLENTESLDDAAIIETTAGRIVASTDFFSSPVNDPWLAGRIAALHSASDLVAMGSTITAALANVVVPEGDSRSQRNGLRDLIAGAELEFEAMGASVVGGHTIVGSRWEVGFTVIGQPASETLLRKHSLRHGDLLYVTKPLGTGILLAAHMRGRCDSASYLALIDAMLERQHVMTSVVSEYDIVAGTDITGFGLAGHLMEMLTASHKSAVATLEDIPLLEGVERALAAGIESTLAPANRHVLPQLDISADLLLTPHVQVLFDPQTCGGLLLGVPADRAADFEKAVATQTSLSLFRIGAVREADNEGRVIRFV